MTDTDGDGDGVLDGFDAFPEDQTNWTGGTNTNGIDSRDEYILDSSTNGNTYYLNKTTTGVKFYDSGNDSDFYGNNENYSITFISPQNTVITISGVFDLETSYDFLYLRGIDSSGGETLLNGSTTALYTTFSNKLIVRFTSDMNTVNAGWEFTLNLDTASNYTNTDTDNDMVDNIPDPDDDNDGVLDVVDAFPLDSTETVDTDNDGTGNTADTDDDNDGVADVDDDFPLDATKADNEIITVKAGWNIISCSIDSNKNQIIDDSNSIIISDIWEYDEIYKDHPRTDPLDPKKGYWVKCTQAGTLTFKNK